MDNVNELKQRASTLRKQGDYGEAAQLFQVLWEEHRDQCSEWEGWGYAYSLRKLGRSAEALEVCRQALPLNPSLDHLNSLCGWCLYDTEIKRSDGEIQANEARFLNAADEILGLGTPGQFSAHARTLLRVIDYYRQKPTSPAAKILEWCDRIQPEQLSDAPGSGSDGRGRTVAYASDREKWYACRSKALLELERFEECIAFSEQALDAFSDFHHDNDVWFRWRIALARAGLGDKETAIAELEGLLSRKQDWFFQHRIAQYLLELGRTSEATTRAVEAALGPGPRELRFKWELFMLMGRIYEALGDLELARRHILLAARVRQEADWPIPPELSQAIIDLDVDMSDQISAQDLERELRQGWQALKLADMPQGQGEIKNLVGTGNAGFIRGDDGQDYYFKVSWFRGPRDRIEPGMRVTFHIEKNPEPGKRDMAKYVRPL